MKKKKKGFTLIELLVVMVVLAIIALITVPNALNMIETAQERSFRSSTQGLIKASENLYVLDKTGNGNVPIFVLFNEGDKTVYPNDKDIVFNGNNPKSGGIHIFEDGSIKLALYDGVHCSVKDRSSEEIVVSKMSESECVSNIYYSQVNAPFNNLVINGDFSAGNDILATGWGRENTLLSEVITSNRYQRLYSGDVHSTFRLIYNFSVLPILNNRYYVNIDFLEGHNIYTPTFQLSSVHPTYVSYGGDNILIGKNSYVVNASDSRASTATSFRIQLNFSHAGAYLNGNAYATVKAVMFMNLTEAFGTGNEPTKEQMDEIINRVWINNSGAPSYFTAGGWQTF